MKQDSKGTHRTYCTLCVFMLLASLATGCRTNVEDKRDLQNLMPTRDVNAVKEAHTDELMSIPGVVGVYVGAREDGSPCIRVMVVESKPELEERIPKVLEGYPVEIEETGEIRPLREKHD